MRCDFIFSMQGAPKASVIPSNASHLSKDPVIPSEVPREVDAVEGSAAVPSREPCPRIYSVFAALTIHPMKVSTRNG